jgi:hypothetical protein
MRIQRLGCLTPAGLLAVLVTLLIIAGAAFFQGGSMFSPGGLSASSGAVLGGVDSHQALGGNCAACHTAPWDPQMMSSRCLECHTNIQADLNNPASLHGALIDDPAFVNCRECHTEHHGPLASLTNVQVVNFPHDRTGYSLLAHASHADGSSFTCGDCHGERLSQPDQAVCADCHRKIDPRFDDVHPAFGGNCLGCHDGVDTYGAGFDHAHTRFPLEGQHAEIECTTCHAGMETLQELRATPQDCFSCHAKDDFHAGQMGTTCGVCHTSAGWLPAVFDHSQTAFVLFGKHAETACRDCHADHPYKGTPRDCFSCHSADDAHAGELGSDCAACHSPVGWVLATFDHNKSAFPLTGAHQSLTCESCHANRRYKGTPTACAGCHSDPAYHAGLFGANCASCHNTARWLPASFNGAHSFPMNHGQANACRDCHPSTLNTWTCYTCHSQSDIDKEHRKEGIGDYANCLRCHPDGREGNDGDRGDARKEDKDDDD